MDADADIPQRGTPREAWHGVWRPIKDGRGAGISSCLDGHSADKGAKEGRRGAEEHLRPSLDSIIVRPSRRQGKARSGSARAPAR